MNYQFGIGIALWATAAWVALRERRWPWRMAVSAVFVIVLFFCHPRFALGVYGVALLARSESGHGCGGRRAQPASARASSTSAPPGSRSCRHCRCC